MGATIGRLAGKAPSERPALKPHWGKPAVRNFRGGDGDVGIIRSPVRAIALPDNRYGAEEEETLQRRSSDPLWPRVLRWASRGARLSVNRGIGGVGD